MSEVQDKASVSSAVPAAEHAPHGQQAQGQAYQFQQPSPYSVGYPPIVPYVQPHGQDTNGHAPSDPNASPGPYMMAFPPPPPGVIYAYPAAPGYPAMPFSGGMPLPAALVRPKRKQVKMACTNCAAACKRCDDGRPCQRCIKYNLQDSCMNGTRKERKKGVKRGPYKRKGKPNEGELDVQLPGHQQDQHHQQQPSPEALYSPYFYPPPGFVAIGPDGQTVHSANDATQAPQTGSQAPQYYSIQPYPPFAFSGVPFPMFPGHMAPPPSGSHGTPGHEGVNDHMSVNGMHGNMNASMPALALAHSPHGSVPMSVTAHANGVMNSVINEGGDGGENEQPPMAGLNSASAGSMPSPDVMSGTDCSSVAGSHRQAPITPITPPVTASDAGSAADVEGEEVQVEGKGRKRKGWEGMGQERDGRGAPKKVIGEMGGGVGGLAIAQAASV